MLRRLLVPLAVVAVLALALAPATTVDAARNARNLRAQLSGRDEVPVRETRARGTTTLSLSADGETLSYKLAVVNIKNVVAAHIHVGAAGVNGPVVAFLYGMVPAGGGTFNGIIAEGELTAASLIGPLAGQPLSALVDEILAGNTYVNVHTNDGVGATNTGPGDFPGGEIRGQIR